MSIFEKIKAWCMQRLEGFRDWMLAPLLERLDQLEKKDTIVYQRQGPTAVNGATREPREFDYEHRQ